MLRGATAKTCSMPGTWPHAGLMTRPSMPSRRSQWPVCMAQSACGCRWCRLELSRGSWTGGRSKRAGTRGLTKAASLGASNSSRTSGRDSQGVATQGTLLLISGGVRQLFRSWILLLHNVNSAYEVERDGCPLCWGHKHALTCNVCRLAARQPSTLQANIILNCMDLFCACPHAVWYRKSTDILYQTSSEWQSPLPCMGSKVLHATVDLALLCRYSAGTCVHLMDTYHLDTMLCCSLQPQLVPKRICKQYGLDVTSQPHQTWRQH